MLKLMILPNLASILVCILGGALIKMGTDGEPLLAVAGAICIYASLSALTKIAIHLNELEDS